MKCPEKDEVTAQSICDRWGFVDVWCGAACGPGWFSLLETAFAQLRDIGWSGQVEQIKEKFGTLRLYIAPAEGLDQEISMAGFKIVDAAETDSATICEDCGKSGKLRSGGWIRTLCDDCL